MLSVLALFVVNGAILGVLYRNGIILQPSIEELEAERLEQKEIKKAAADALKYAHLEPLPEFKSRANYVASLGEAIRISENKLHEKEPGRKSWAINYIESRYLPSMELYKVFLDYETIVPLGEEPKIMKVTCEVDETTQLITNWGALKG
jgi:hypothetical protein